MCNTLQFVSNVVVIVITIRCLFWLYTIFFSVFICFFLFLENFKMKNSHGIWSLFCQMIFDKLFYVKKVLVELSLYKPVKFNGTKCIMEINLKLVNCSFNLKIYFLLKFSRGSIEVLQFSASSIVFLHALYALLKIVY